MTEEADPAERCAEGTAGESVREAATEKVTETPREIPPYGQAFWCERRLFPNRGDTAPGGLGHPAITVYLALCAHLGEPYFGPQSGVTSLALLAALLGMDRERCREALIQLRDQQWIALACGPSSREGLPDDPKDRFAFHLLGPDGRTERQPGNQYFRLDCRLFDLARRLETTGIAAIACISRRCDQHGVARLSGDRLAEEIGVTPRSDTAIIRRLVAVGLIATSPGDQTRRGVPEACTEYRLLPWPEAAPDESE